MLRILYYLCKKFSTKKGGGLIIRHGRIIRILRYVQRSSLREPRETVKCPSCCTPYLNVNCVRADQLDTFDGLINLCTRTCHASKG